ncbi:MAG: hypothetical protein U9R16_03250 [Campylobacterota bacterium]|nr:hypothetical protein [Campylobacterota bacterium]
MLIKIAIAIFIAIILYGFYEKDRRTELYKNFRENKPILCDGVIIQKSDGWSIHNNRFFTNGKVMKTVVFCNSIDK